MATTTNYGWTTPDDTALVKDGAAAIRTLGSSVDTTTKALNPSTTLGDIEYRSSTANTNTRLGIGTTGQVLTVAGGVPSWATSAGGAANWSLLNTGGTALTGATTITVSGITGADKIMILFTNTSSVDPSATIAIRLNGDTGNNYTAHGSRIIWNGTYSADNGRFINRSAQSSIFMALLTDAEASVTEGYLLLSGCNTSGLKMFNGVGSKNTNDIAGGAYYSGGFYNSSSTISSISMFSNSGNFDSGTVFVYTSA